MIEWYELNCLNRKKVNLNSNNNEVFLLWWSWVLTLRGYSVHHFKLCDELIRSQHKGRSYGSCCASRADGSLCPKPWALSSSACADQQGYQVPANLWWWWSGTMCRPSTEFGWKPPYWLARLGFLAWGRCQRCFPRLPCHWSVEHYFELRHLSHPW